MYNLESPSPNEGRMPGASSAIKRKVATVSLKFEEVTVPDKNHPCRGCAGYGNDILCQALPECRDVIFVKI